MSTTNMTSTDALVSVIVPVYKVEAYLDRCVQSIVDQRYKNLEIILVDDGSPDTCPTICEAWAEKDERICVIHKENGGLSDARNAGMAVARGEYIAFIDSDDWIAPEMLQRLYEAMQRDDSDIAACTVEMVWEDETPSRLLTVRTNGVLKRNNAQRALLEESLLKQPVWYKLYRREIIDGIPFEVGKYHEDVYWSYQAIGAAKRVSLIDYIGYFYWQRSGSIMGESYSLKRLDAIEAIERRQSYLAEFFPGLEREARIKLWESCIYNGQMALKYLSKDDCRKALSYLKKVKNRYPLKWKDYRDQKVTHRLWLDIARVSLRTICSVRNALGINVS